MPPILVQYGLDRLTRDERLMLVTALWDSIAAEGGSLLTDAQRAELERRADDDANPDDLIPWEQVKADGRARMKS